MRKDKVVLLHNITNEHNKDPKAVKETDGDNKPSKDSRV
jgi:hypothetical protein